MRVTGRIAGSGVGASLVLSLIAGGALAGCSSSAAPSGSATANVSVLLTDSPFPFDQFSRADLFIVSVAAGVDSGSGGAQCTGATVVARPGRTIDLLALQHGVTELLGTADLPAGDYGAVCITIDTDRSSLTMKSGTVLAHNTNPGINWSATGQRIIKTNIFQPIGVSDSSGTILIHFDVGRSFIPSADVTPPGPANWYYYVPAIDAMDPATVGSISGTVVDGQAGSAAVAGASVRVMVGDPSWAPDTWFVAATGATDAQGRFTLAYLAPSAHWATHGWVYTVEVYPPTMMTRAVARRSGVAVTAGSQTAIGAIPLN